MRTRITLTAALAAVLALGSVGPNIASAAPLAPLPAVEQTAGNGHLIEVAAKKKRVYRRNDAAAAAAFMGIMGGMMALAAQDSYRDRYYGRSGYYDRGRQYYRGRHYNAPRQHYRGGNQLRGFGLESPHPQNYGPGPHPPIQNWGMDR